MSASEFDSPKGSSSLGWTAPEGWLQTPGCQLAAYLPLEGLAVGRRVLDVDGLPAAQERLRQAGAKTVVGVGAAPWQVPNGSIDAVFILSGGGFLDARALAEAGRVLSSGGFIAIRLPAGEFGRGELVSRLASSFSTVEVINQVPVAGFTFDRAGSREVVVAEDLFPAAALPSHFLALCGTAAAPAWGALPSWVIPLANPSLGHASPPLPDERAAWEQKLRELSYEREYLREAVMTLQDERDRLQRLATNLRREADRNLARMSDQAAALEELGLQRDPGTRG